MCNQKNRFIAVLMAFVTAFGTFLPLSTLLQPFTVYAAADPIVVTAYYGFPIPASMINYDGGGIGASAFIEKDGVEYPAFCIDPKLPGVESHTDHEYPIQINGTNMSPQVSTILHNSVPYKPKADILAQFPGLTDQQIYAATKAAVRAVTSPTIYPNINLWGGDPQTVAYAKFLITLALNNPEDVTEMAKYGTSGLSILLADENYFYRTTTVQSSNYPLADGTKIRLKLPPNAPVGTIITDGNDVELPKTNGYYLTDNSGFIKIKVPKSSIPDGASGSFEIKVELTVKSDVILFGIPIKEEDIGKYQRYEVSMPEQDYSFSIQMGYWSEPTPSEPIPSEPTPSEPTPSEPTKTPEVGGIKIVKYNNVNGELASGAVFEVKGLDAENNHILFQVQASAGAVVPFVENGAKVTVGNGTITVSGISVGKYLITEITPPPNFDMSPDATYSRVVEVQATSNPTVYPQVTFRNNPFGNLKITKIDAVSGQPVAGVWLRIRNPLTGLDITRQTGANGIITLDGLPEGNYEISETSAGSDYELNTNILVVPVRWGQLSEAVFKNEPHTSLEVTKIDSKTNKAVAGAMFTLKQLSTGKEWTLTTLADGHAVVDNIPAGNYTIREVYVPEPLILDSSVYNIQINNDKTNQYVARNDEKPIITLEKYDEQTGELLGGAEFRLERLDSAWQTEFMMDGTGKRMFTVNPGTYRFTEIVAPWGYLPVTDHKEFTVGPNDEITIKFDNRPCPKLEILKIDQDGNPLSGAVFHIGRTEGETVMERVTDHDGRILLEDLDESIYYIKEVKAPTGYVIDANCHRDILLEWGKTKTLIFTNTKKPELTILKIDEETKEPLPGAKFRITATEGVTVLEEITDSEGKIVLTDLLPGIYSVEELTAPSGYLLETQHKDVELLPGDIKQLVFTNKARPKLRILKVDVVTGEPLANAEFRVSKAEDATVSEYITDSTGEILIENLDEAIYRAEEFMPPDGYILYTESKEILTEWGKTKTLKFDNVRKPTLIFTKLNGLTNQPIAGAVFRIDYEDVNGGVVTLGTFRTNADGKIIIPKVNSGWYIFTEIQPAPGYSLPSNPVTRRYFAPGENAYLTTETGGSTTGTGDVSATGGGDYIAGTSPDGHLVYNFPLNSIVIKKTDVVTGELLAGAVFELYRADEQVSGVPGTAIGRFTTDISGIIVITGLQPGFFVIKEVQAPPNYLISENSMQNGLLKADGTTVLEFAFANIPYGSILVTKVDSVSGKPLANARFRVTDASGAVAGNTNGEFVTNENGEFIVPDLKPGAYVITEIEAPEYYSIDTTPQTVNVGTDGKVYKVNFKNQPAGEIVIRKLDYVTKEPLADAEFKITTSTGSVIGTSDGIFRTDASGTIKISGLPKVTYVLEEIKAPAGFILENQTQTIAVDYGKTYTIDFYNKKMSGAQIIKIDATTKEPLKGAKFTVYKQPGEIVGTYETNGDGVIILDTLEPGWYKACEAKAPDGWLIDDTPQDFQITYKQFVKLVFENKRLSSLQIRKVSETDGSPLAGAVFEVRKQNGEFVGEFTTGNDGMVSIPNATPAWYVISETKAPTGFILDNTAKTVEVKPVMPSVVTFTNKPLSGIEILKVDAFSNAPLSGATFIVERDTGERIGTYKTDKAGKIIVSGLAEGTYIVSETVAPDGYTRDELPKTVVVKSGKLTTVEFANKPMAGLKIVKLNSLTRKPIEDVEFVIAKMNGEKVENDVRGYTFKTDKTGQIYIPNLADGYYTVTETRQASGYFLDGEPKTVLIQSGKTTILEVLNTPMSGLLIVKTDVNTDQPLQGVVFDVRRADGQFIAGDILDKNQPDTVANSPNRTTSPNGDITGSFTTDTQGRILINGLEVGEYHVIERKAAEGYELDASVHSVTVTPGKQATLQLTNKPKAGLRLIKIDAFTKEPIFGVEFMVFDANKNVVGVFYTDDKGVIDFAGILPEGRYSIRETRAAQGYTLDEIPRTVEFTAGKFTEIKWENVPQLGQIQLFKKSADNNEINGLPAGTSLEGAIFEAYEYKSGNLVDRFVSGADGRAVSKPLPLGRYIIKEIQAPQWYKLSTEALDIDLEFAGQIIKREFLNYSANTGVAIRKTGNVEAMPGDVIKYDIKELRNISTVPLSDFYWRDVLPVDAVRLTKIVTGTFNQSLKYKLLITTNKGDTRIIADNLITTKNNVIDCSNASLDLRNDEFVTSFMFVFGTVKAGFSMVEAPQVYTRVLNRLPNNYQFANKVDIGGRYGQQEWINGNSTWLTTIYSPNSMPGGNGSNNKLPKTGY